MSAEKVIMSAEKVTIMSAHHGDMSAEKKLESVSCPHMSAEKVTMSAEMERP